MKKLIFLLIIAGLAMGGMKAFQSVKRGMVVGDAALAEFHEAMNARKEAEIYDRAAAGMHSAVKKEDFMKFADQLRTEFGAFKSATRDGVDINNANGNTTLLVTCTAIYEKSEVQEEFLFDYNSESPLLVRYDFKKKPGVTPHAP